MVKINNFSDAVIQFITDTKTNNVFLNILFITIIHDVNKFPPPTLLL